MGYQIKMKYSFTRVGLVVDVDGPDIATQKHIHLQELLRITCTFQWVLKITAQSCALVPLVPVELSCTKQLGVQETLMRMLQTCF